MGPPKRRLTRDGRTLTTLRVDGVAVAEYVAGDRLAPGLAPRPYLHPVRTLDGVAITDAMPNDHPWHLGLSVAMQDVVGWNFWGGPTFVRRKGYVARDDHGSVKHAGFDELHDEGFTERLRWDTGEGHPLLAQQRRVDCRRAGVRWELTIATTLANPWIGTPIRGPSGSTTTPDPACSWRPGSRSPSRSAAA